jgi:hypothetical protein
MEEWILVCECCGDKRLVRLIPTASPACQVCGSFDIHMHLAIVIDARVLPAETYAWTPWMMTVKWMRYTFGLERAFAALVKHCEMTQKDYEQHFLGSWRDS